MTYTRISRCLFHILLNMTKKEFETCKAEDYISYARVLGFARMQLLSLPRSKEQLHSTHYQFGRRKTDTSRRCFAYAGSGYSPESDLPGASGTEE